MGALSLAAAWHSRSGWALGLRAQLPVVSALVTHAPQGSANAWPTLVGAEVGHSLGRESWVVHPDVGLGVGAMLLHLDGDAKAPFDSGSADVWMTAVLARGGLAVKIAGPLRLRADVSLGGGAAAGDRGVPPGGEWDGGSSGDVGAVHVRGWGGAGGRVKLPRFPGQVVKAYAAFFFSKQSSNDSGVAYPSSECERRRL